LGWTITHVGSGLMLGSNLRSKATARRRAQALVALGDFTRPAEQLTNDTKLRAAARPILYPSEAAGNSVDGGGAA
jgi:hypothetical protein